MHLGISGLILALYHIYLRRHMDLIRSSIVQQNRVKGGLSFQQINVSISQSDFCGLSLISTVYQPNQPFRFNGTDSTL